MTGLPRSFRQDESIILDGPSLGMDLPVITSPEPEDTQTPMAETKTFTSGLILLKSENNNKQNRNHLVLEGLEQQQEKLNREKKNKLVN